MLVFCLYQSQCYALYLHQSCTMPVVFVCLFFVLHQSQCQCSLLESVTIPVFCLHQSAIPLLLSAQSQHQCSVCISHNTSVLFVSVIIPQCSVCISQVNSALFASVIIPVFCLHQSQLIVLFLHHSQSQCSICSSHN